MEGLPPKRRRGEAGGERTAGILPARRLEAGNPGKSDCGRPARLPARCRRSRSWRGSPLTVAHIETGAFSGVVGLRLHNRVLPVLFLAGVAAVLATGFVTLAPNRLLTGLPVGLFAADPALAAAV